ncbi:MAG TPA: biotin/lipoyl-binding protein [Gammaproteobacteria bacterium]|nr:biotin/lipoyl-binding protein [Gammaproteobacteria bacterium]
MKNHTLFVLALLGVLAGLISAFIYGREKVPQPPVFNPATNPYAKGIYAEGIVESYQTSGENINIYPEVAGVITRILVTEGQIVAKGAPLITLDDSVQRATAEQQKSQAEAALALFQELKAQPRPENLEVAGAQVDAAGANLKSAQDESDKQNRLHRLNPQLVSQETVDNATNAFNVAKANLEVARKQYELTKAGAWLYDIQNQEHQYDALEKAYAASNALLSKYTVTAPEDGVILSIAAAVGSYVSPQGIYDTYSQGAAPVIVMGGSQDVLGVRVYVDEILVHRLPDAAHMRATMFIRGTGITAPLEFVRVQPYVSPKIELSNQRTERVDVRVLPVIFKFRRAGNLHLYPGQLADVYIGEG